MRVLPTIVLGATVFTFCAKVASGLTFEEFSACYEAHKNGIWPSYEFHECVLKYDTFNHTLSQNLAIKECQGFKNSMHLPRNIYNYIQKLYSEIDKCNSDTEDLIQYLTGLPEKIRKPFQEYRINENYMRKFTEMIDTLMYYAYYHKGMVAIYEYRKQIMQLVNTIKNRIVSRSGTISMLMSYPYWHMEGESGELISREYEYYQVRTSNIHDILLMTINDFSKLKLVLQNVQSATIGESFVPPPKLPGVGAITEDTIKTMYKCINKSISNTNALAPDNAGIQKDSILVPHLKGIELLKSRKCEEMELALKKDEQELFALLEKSCNALKELIEKKLKRAVEMTKNDNLGTEKTEQDADGKQIVRFSNLNAYDSQFEWADGLDYEVYTRDPSILSYFILTELEIIAEYGILAEAQVIFG
ncbi:hypothetical protein AX774_g2953 [Zancudomyces culisetae]|uniref:Uncharacterized protein n=1 Tax=Zancudomyces culisetae TaxID=1213189 RepID=A0A1R1PRC9_ZANCU|nr:hypothetical protein AX774_g2953 [Zancudomyces culisetae]|eukprot:OMH83536.1 hypothetical protein AX774_g2953 [Zancudomyces culisetae]